MRDGVHILIIDDDANICKNMGNILSDEGYGIASAGTVALAKKKLTDKFYNIALIDLKLPNGSGLELLKEIKKISRETIVIVFTGFASLESALSVMNEGAFAYLQKPLNIDEVKITMEKALKMQKLSLDNKNLLIELQKKIKEIENLYKLKSEFTSMVSHELKTPLIAMKEGINFVLDGSIGPVNEEQKKFLGLAKKNTERLSRLINDVLDFSKLTSGKIKLKKEIEIAGINGIIKSVVDTYRLPMRRKHLLVATKLKVTKGLKMELDPDRINQVLVNLIDNAVKFTDKGVITIFTAKEKDTNFVKICVRDTGKGIKQSDIPKLFHPFVQLEDEKERKMGSTGLGLAICKEIIEQGGGRIWIESEFGKGSCFCFIFPIKERRRAQ